MYFSFSVLKSEITLKAKSAEERDLGCITLLKLASEKSKKKGEMVKYEKLKKLKKTYLTKYWRMAAMVTGWQRFWCH